MKKVNILLFGCFFVFVFLFCFLQATAHKGNAFSKMFTQLIITLLLMNKQNIIAEYNYFQSLAQAVFACYTYYNNKFMLLQCNSIFYRDTARVVNCCNSQRTNKKKKTVLQKLTVLILIWILTSGRNRYFREHVFLACQSGSRSLGNRLKYFWASWIGGSVWTFRLVHVRMNIIRLLKVYRPRRSLP